MNTAQETPGTPVEHPHHKWTFLTNHAHVLLLISQEPDLVLREVAARVGITERAVQRIVAELEEGHFIVRKRIGRNNHYDLNLDQPLRHNIEMHKSIGDLISFIARPAAQTRPAS